MKRPLAKYTKAPANSQGAFAARRRFDIHTGIDCYCKNGDIVMALEPGVVVNVCDFTGANADSPWWCDTKAVLVEGKSGVILYGELDPSVKVGDMIDGGDTIGFIRRVLKNDKGQHTSMLHLELYETGYRGDGEIWNLLEKKPNMLLDPTDLVDASNLD